VLKERRYHSRDKRIEDSELSHDLEMRLKMKAKLAGYKDK